MIDVQFYMTKSGEGELTCAQSTELAKVLCP